MIIDEVSKVKKMIDMINKISKQASTNYDILFGCFLILLVGYFQQLTPVGYSAMYSGECLPFQFIENIFLSQESHRQAVESQEAFIRILSHCQQGNVDESYWNLLKGIFCQTATDSKHEKWDNAPHLFYDKNRRLNTI